MLTSFILALFSFIVALEAPYNNSVDVYSFGIILWELCSGEKPFFGYSSGKHMQHVVLGGERPKMDSHHTAYWPANLQWLMHGCWSPIPDVRPSFVAIKQVLHDILDGKESVPASIAKAVEPAIEEPAGGFSGFFQPLSRRVSRAGTTGCVVDIESPKEGFQGVKPPNGTGGRSRSWGFSLKR
jgi:serine/threonine protein kinase